MHKAIVMHESYPFQHLGCDEPCLEFWKRFRQVSLEVAQLKIFHRDEERIFYFKPPIGADKAMRILAHS
jgi:hypothetical protein